MQAGGRGMGRNIRGTVRAGGWAGASLFGIGSARRGTDILTAGDSHMSGLRQRVWTRDRAVGRLVARSPGKQ